MESYQAIYDAVRSKISGGNVGEVLADAARNAFDVSHQVAIIQQEFCIAAGEMQRPSVVYRPSLSIDGTKWCALYGENIVEGVAAFGDTPDEAMRNFDQAWMHERTPAARKIASAVPA